MANLILQGQLAVGSNIVYTAGDITLCQVIAIKYYNSAAYDIELRKYKSSTTSTVTFYNLSLAAGVPVDNTTGTAIISITDMGALLASYNV